MRYVFDDFELDLGAYELRRAGRPVRVQPKVFDLIRYFAERPSQVVTHRELLSGLWPGEVVSDSAMSWCIHQARKALGQRRGSAAPIETLQRRGYRFNAEISIAGEDRSSLNTLVGLASGPPTLPPLAVPPPIAQAIIGDDTLIGRDDVLRQLALLLAKAGVGAGNLALLVGEPGIGKTRCASALIAQAQVAGFRVLAGRAVETQAAPLLWPWITVLRELKTDPVVGQEPRAILEELAGHGRRSSPTQGPNGYLGSVGHTSNEVLQTKDSQDESARFWLFDRIVRALLAVSQKVPLCIWLEDLHWADEASLQVLALLSFELAQRRIFVLGTQRNAEPGLSLTQGRLLRRISRAGTELRLSGLSMSDVGRYVAEHTGEPSETLSQLLHERTGGNPLFVRETLRLLASRGAIGEAANPELGIELPPAVKDVLRGRVERVPPAVRELLGVASALGNDVNVPLLARVSGLLAHDVLGFLQVAVSAGFLGKRSGTGRYAFTHALVREAIYEDLPPQTRARLHHRIGNALEELPDRALRTRELAMHFHEAISDGQADKAFVHARAAGEAAMRALAYDQAARCFSWALDADRARAHGDARSHAELLKDLTAALRKAGRAQECVEQLSALVELARAQGYGDLLLFAGETLRPSRGIAMLPDELALMALREALRLLPSDAHALRSRALAQLACIPPASRVLEESKALSMQAVAEAERSADGASLMNAWNARLHALSNPDDAQELLDVSAGILRMDQDPPTWMSGDAHGARYHVFLMLGDLGAAEHALGEISRIAEQLHYVEAMWMCERLRAGQLFRAGRLAEAASAFLANYERIERGGASYGGFFYRAQMAELLREQNGFVGLGAQFSTAHFRARPVWSVISVRAGVLRTLCDTGQYEEARRELETLHRDGFERITRDHSWLYTLACLAEVSVTLNEQPAARALYTLLEPHSALDAVNGVEISVGAVAYYLAILAAQLSDSKAAKRYFEQALEVDTRMQAPAKIARTQYAYAAFLALDPKQAAQKRSQELLAHASATAHELGLVPLQAKTRELAERRPAQAAVRGKTA